MRQLKNIACRGFILLWWLTHVGSHDVEMYQRHLILGPFCNTFASLFLTWPDEFNGLKGNGCPLSVLRRRLLMETPPPWHATILFIPILAPLFRCKPIYRSKVHGWFLLRGWQLTSGGCNCLTTLRLSLQPPRHLCHKWEYEGCPLPISSCIFVLLEEQVVCDPYEP